MAELIYLADDEVSLTSVYVAFLEGAGYEVVAFPTGDELYAAFLRRACDLAVLDGMMPGTDGLAVCQMLREISDVPIVMLTARDSEMDYLRGLAVGGDDYLTKPFPPAMLVMRVKSLLRRVVMDRAQGPTGDEFAFGDVALSVDAHKVTVAGVPVELTMTEFSLLRHLMEGAGEAVSRDTLLSRIWGIDGSVETRAVDECVHRVRAKLRKADSTVRIKAVWGYGSRLEAKEDAR